MTVKEATRAVDDFLSRLLAVLSWIWHVSDSSILIQEYAAIMTRLAIAKI
jgi:hypothetical protein